MLSPNLIPINYQILSQAIQHYQTRGYKYIEVPWLVSPEANDATRPPDAKPLEGFYGKNGRDELTYAGSFIASGEQSFVQMMLEKRMPEGKFMTCTPCFRVDEPDELHYKQFMKVELIYVPNLMQSITNCFTEVLQDALEFYKQHQPDVLVEYFDRYTADIVTRKNNIELGSYGFRLLDGRPGCYWIYGTGVALPRLEIAMEKENVEK